MNSIKVFALFCTAAVLSGCTLQLAQPSQYVNAVIGDLSFTKTFGTEPTSETDEILRLQTHLKYVEETLRKRSTAHLSTEQKENRLEMMDLLNRSWKAGVFPKNYDYPGERKPCFIDRDGNICAVGYLVEQILGREAAEAINSKYKYKYLLNMVDDQLDSWIAVNGLSKEECAMIQPGYGFPTLPPPGNYTVSDPANEISTAVWGGLNVSLSAINTLQIAKGGNSKTAPILGLISGAGQITLGALNYPVAEQYGTEWVIDSSQRNLALANIGLGATTMILSSWNLITNRKPVEKSLSWNVYSFPTLNSTTGVGISFTKKL